MSVVVLPDEEVDWPKPICRPPPYTHACRSPSLPPLQEERAHPFAGNGQPGDDYFMVNFKTVLYKSWPVTFRVCSVWVSNAPILAGNGSFVPCFRCLPGIMVVSARELFGGIERCPARWAEIFMSSAQEQARHGQGLAITGNHAT